MLSLREAIEDGVLVEIFKNRWNDLSGGKSIVASMNLFDGVKHAGLRKILDEFVEWKTQQSFQRTDKEKRFATKVNGLPVWVIEDDIAVTLMYPEDY